MQERSSVFPKRVDEDAQRPAEQSEPWAIHGRPGVLERGARTAEKPMVG